MRVASWRSKVQVRGPLWMGLRGAGVGLVAGVIGGLATGEPAVGVVAGIGAFQGAQDHVGDTRKTVPFF